jgi:hypothetical protein
MDLTALMHAPMLFSSFLVMITTDSDAIQQRKGIFGLAI